MINFLKSIGLTFTDRNSAKNALRYLNIVSYEKYFGQKMIQKQFLLTPWRIFQNSIRYKSRSTFHESTVSSIFSASELMPTSSDNSAEIEAKPIAKREDKSSFVPFNEYIETRREAAKRSVLVQVKSGL